MPVTKDKSAPYAPAKTIVDILDRYRQRGLPTPIDSETLQRAGVPPTLVPRVAQSLKALDLIDDEGTPTPTFEGIRLAPETEYKRRLEDWLKGTYADVFSFVDPTKDGPDRIRDAFRGYNPIGQQERMVMLFEGLCVLAGLIAERPARPSPTANLGPKAKAGVRRLVQERLIKPAQPPSTSLGLPAPLAGLLASLPADGQGWTAPKRDQFLATFEAVLDFCVPVVAHEPDDDEEGDEAA